MATPPLSVRFPVVIMAGLLLGQMQAGTFDLTTSSGSAGADTWVANSVTATPSEESFHEDGSPIRIYGSTTENHGNERVILVGRMSYGNWQAQGLLRFDTSTLPKGTVESASLTLPLSERSLSGYPFEGGEAGTANEVTIEALGLSEAAENWDEKTVTWEKGRPEEMVPVGSVTVRFESYVGDVFTISDEKLVSFLNANANGSVSILLRQKEAKGDTNFVAFDSKESGTGSGPSLQIQIAPSKP